MNEAKKNDAELGALWISTGPRGEYLTGTVNGVRVVCFKNDRKPAGSAQPDWRVIKAKARDVDEGPRQPFTDEDAPF